MNNNILLLVSNNTPSYIFNCLKNYNLYKIDYLDNGLIIEISYNDYKIISKRYPYFNYEILKYYGLNGLINYLKEHMYLIIFNIISLIIMILLSNIIFDINIIHEDKNIINIINNELMNNNLKKYTFKKDYNEIQVIKNKILNKYPDEIEWLEIKVIGMKYVINIEERIVNKEIINSPYCHVIAKKSAILKSINPIKGYSLYQNNDYVRSGDIIISGDISLNGALKNQVCAKGEVYGEVWYTANVSIPKELLIKKYTDKKRYNISYDYNNYHKIFRPQFNKFDTIKKELFKIFDLTIYFETEYEYEEIPQKLSSDEIIKYAENKAIESLNIKLSDKESIISKNVLKKSINDSTINIELFLVVKELIGEQINGSSEGIDSDDTT